MIGVIVLSLGVPPMYASLDHGPVADIGLMVAGYVIMRASMMLLWSQVARHDPPHRRTARIYLCAVGVTQAGWVVLAVIGAPVTATFAWCAVLLVAEFAGPRVAERCAGTPWHAEHIAERHGLLVIVTLGEVIIGATAAVNALVHSTAGWSTDAALLLIAGIGLPFGCWWMYFAIPWAEPLRRHRDRAPVFSYGHLAVFVALAAVGGGLEAAASELEHEAEIEPAVAVATVAVPVGLYIVVAYVLYSQLTRTYDAFHLALLLATAAMLALAMVLPSVGASVPACLLVVTAAPALTIVGYELIARKRVTAAVQRT